MRTSPRRLAGYGLAAIATLLLTACGDDAPPADARAAGASPASESTSSGSTAPSASPEITSDLDKLGFALKTALGEDTTYRVDGSKLRVKISDNFTQYLSTECTSVSLAASSVTLPPDSVVEIEYADGHVEVCDV
ncbi:hypothetical protein [Micromonospora craniellae]|uniref:Uncharacterized protein n=1 Tax=Micromonospora craniellae TaxID=2294034 RepID=A0A372G491_9ACTN|nr:hypothetical protein [Micromonospora craniellae]QOC93045.1 hypothetical protein ID554_04855 [Micromonospora craniellae]RFS47822.1 hypothetical protein D0Q02_04630 [Micromonospora craniellae]